MGNAQDNGNRNATPLVVLDARLVNESPSGIGVYATEMIRRIPRLAPDLRFLAIFRSEAVRDKALGGDTPENVASSIIPYGPFSPKSQLLIPSFLRRIGALLYHTPHFVMPYLAFPRSLRGKCRCIANIHDIIPLVVPDYAPASRTSKFLGVYRECVRQAILRSHAVITGSRAAKNDIMRVFRFGEDVSERLHVVFDGADLSGKATDDHAPVKAADDTSSPRQLIYVGRMDPYKNVTMLVEAFQHIKAACPFPVRLKVIGPKDARYPEAERRAAELGLADDIAFTGFVSSAELAETYRTADLLAHPSRYEGFGLQLVEAMAAGTPVLCTDGGAQPEVAGEAAVIVPAGEMAAFADAAVAILCNPERQEELRRLGKARAVHFSWDATARATLEIYRQTLQPFNFSTLQPFNPPILQPSS
jgi:glycosyltransferase involved in cell wall biosynthesis